MEKHGSGYCEAKCRNMGGMDGNGLVGRGVGWSWVDFP